MGKNGKTFALLLTVIMVMSCLTLLSVKPASAQSIPIPATPQFTVNYVDHSYYVPVTYTNYTNPYTGQQETKTNGGYAIENKTIDVTIKNQPFTSTNIDGNTTKLFYEIRWKGHFENWTDYNINGINWYSDQPNIYHNYQYGIEASNSDYTIISYTNELGIIPNGGQVDFQVRAQDGYTFLFYGNHAHIQPIGTLYHFVTESDWSNIQTVTISNATLTTPSPTVPELSWLVILPLLLSMFSVAMILRHRKIVSFNKVAN